MHNFAIGFKLADGTIIYCTGKAGKEWTSRNKDDAFYGYSREGVQNLGKKIQQQLSITLKNAELIEVSK